ncbi:MAG: DUF2867 domain-containing protein, partial [Proteobacteria bacterium]|nr:DUF2867 domain-containing protein [Pseudomonadota bacterium]
VGDAVDFWRVLRLEPPRRLILLAEMKLPGEAVLEFRLEPADGRGIDLVMVGRFLPRGLWGIVYWYALMPVHDFIHGRLCRDIAQDTGRTVLAPPRKFTPTLGPTCQPPPAP